VVRLAAAAVLLATAGALLARDTPRAALPRDVLVSDDRSGETYARVDGTSDAVTDACGHGRQPQNEPSVAVDPSDPRVIAVGANEWCPVPSLGMGWQGYYRSTDGGDSWSRFLLPGYRGDTLGSGPSGAKPCRDLSDPALAFDGTGRLYFAILCPEGRGRGRDLVTSVRVVIMDDHGSRYTGTSMVRASSTEVFVDKPAIAVDTTGGPHDGAVYVAYNLIRPPSDRPVCPSVTVEVAASTDRGATFHPASIEGPVCQQVEGDIAVGPGGSVDVVFRAGDGIFVARSMDGGASFQEAVRAASMEGFTSYHFSGGGSRLCGDGPFECSSGQTFARFSDIPTIVEDEGGIHVAFSALRDDRQGKVFVLGSSDGVRWSEPAQVDQEPAGHQWFPDIASNLGVLLLAFYDSRADPGFLPVRAPGNGLGGVSSGPSVDVYLARSADGGQTWGETRLTEVSSNPNYEVVGQGRAPFFGDYISVGSGGDTTFVAWTDSRDVVPGDDPRETDAADDRDGFDVYLPCVFEPPDIDAKRYRRPSPDDPCLSQGGLDLNIYGGRG